MTDARVDYYVAQHAAEEAARFVQEEGSAVKALPRARRLRAEFVRGSKAKRAISLNALIGQLEAIARDEHAADAEKYRTLRDKRDRQSRAVCTLLGLLAANEQTDPALRELCHAIQPAFDDGGGIDFSAVIAAVQGHSGREAYYDLLGLAIDGADAGMKKAYGAGKYGEMNRYAADAQAISTVRDSLEFMV